MELLFSLLAHGAEAKFSENKYFSEAPLPTNMHTALVEEFEASIKRLLVHSRIDSVFVGELVHDAHRATVWQLHEVTMKTKTHWQKVQEHFNLKERELEALYIVAASYTYGRPPKSST